MRIRDAIVVAIAMASLSACSSSGPKSAPTTTAPPGAGAPTTSTSGGGPSGPISSDCAKFIEAARKISAAQGSLYGSGSTNPSTAIAGLVAGLKALQSGAPPEIQAALSDMISGFQDAGTALAHPTAENAAQLATLGRRLGADGQKISTYITSKCHSG